MPDVTWAILAACLAFLAMLFTRGSHESDDFAGFAITGLLAIASFTGAILTVRQVFHG